MFLDPEGTYHLYYQCEPFPSWPMYPPIGTPDPLELDNPTGIVAGNQHWGHTTSKDLYHWTNQPIAIYPGAEGEGIFSGSAVIDVNNTSGFFPNQTNGVVAIYTLHTPTEETQDIAYSTDNGYTFTKYTGNPVLAINSTQFRDPKVIWYAPTQSWVMVVAYARAFTIGIFTSPNLKNWTHASNFSRAGLLGLQYECPNLVPIPLLLNASGPLTPSNFAPARPDTPSYILTISINPGAPYGGSITEYFPGNFNGTHFTTIDNAARIADFGKDNYAGQFFYGIPQALPAISIAWASNWQYSQVVPTGSLENWRSSMTLPRQNVLIESPIGNAGYDLVSYPVDFSSLYTTSTPLVSNSSLGNSSLFVPYGSLLSSGALAFNITISSIPAAAATQGGPMGTVNFTFLSTSTTESLRGGLFLAGDFWLDRSLSSNLFRSNPFFTDKFSSSPAYGDPTANTSRSILGVIDRSIFEVFLDGGQRSATATFFPEGEMDTLVVGAAGISVSVGVSVEVWGLSSTWTGMEGGNGTVTMVQGQKMGRSGWVGGGL